MVSASAVEEARTERRMKQYLGGFFRYLAAAILVGILAALLDRPDELVLRIIAIAVALFTAGVAFYLLYRYRVMRRRLEALMLGQDPDKPKPDR